MPNVYKGLPSIAKPLLSHTGDYTPAVREATSKLKPKAPYGGDMGFLRASTAQSGVKASRLPVGNERSHLISTGRQDKKNAQALLATYRPRGSFASIGKSMVESNVSKGTNIREYSELNENIREFMNSASRIERNPVSPLQALSAGILMARAQSAGYGTPLTRREAKRRGRGISENHQYGMILNASAGHGSVF